MAKQSCHVGVFPEMLLVDKRIQAVAYRNYGDR